MTTILSSREFLENDSVIPRRLRLGTRLKMNLCSPSPSQQGLTSDDNVGVQSVDGVSDSPYTSSNLRANRQPDCSGSDCLQQSSPDGKPGCGLPSIDEATESKKTKNATQEDRRISAVFLL